MSKEQLSVNDSSETKSIAKKFSLKKHRRIGIYWFLIGCLCFIIERIISFVDFNLMMVYGIEHGISASPLGFLCASVLWSAIRAICYTIAFILIFFNFDKLKAKIQSITNAEDPGSENSVHY